MKLREPQSATYVQFITMSYAPQFEPAPRCTVLFGGSSAEKESLERALSRREIMKAYAHRLSRSSKPMCLPSLAKLSESCGIEGAPRRGVGAPLHNMRAADSLNPDGTGNPSLL